MKGGWQEKQIRNVRANLRRMERIKLDIAWLINRDSNCSNAACLCDGIEVLIDKAISLHAEELTRLKKGKA